MDCKKVSVIVPVYNVEKYLVRCLDSLCRQSLRDIEIILVDDASSDRCGEICEEFATKDARFKVIHHPENKGPGAARNTGIAHATCDYLMFVDSDDVVHEDFCKLPFECAVQNRADLVMFGYQQAGIMKLSEAETESVPSGFTERKQTIELTFKAYGMVAWNKLYRKSLFKGIIYPEGVLYEDTATTYKLIWKAEKIYCIDKVLYYYHFHPESITARLQKIETIRNQFAVCWQQCNDLSGWHYASESFDLYRTNIALTYCIKKSVDFSDPFYYMAAQYLRHLVNVPPKFTWKRKLLLTLFRLSPRLFSFVCMISGKQVAQ